MAASIRILRTRVSWFSTMIFLAAASLSAAQTAQMAQRKVLPGHVPAAVAGLQAQGRLESWTRLKLSIGLPLHNTETLQTLIEQLYDPASPEYHHYLSPEEFDRQFGPTEADYEAVAAFATRSGFTIAVRHPNRMLLEVSATAGDIERAFQVTLRIYAHPTEGRTFYAPDAEPSVAADVPILNLGGLDNFARPHPASLHHAPMTAAKAKQLIGSGPNGNLGGFDYRAAYAAGVTNDGSGQMVGLVEFDGYYPNDIASYDSQSGMTNVPLAVVLLDGFDGVATTGTNSANSEVALDIEMATSMAPALAQVVVFEADPTNGLFNDVLQAMSTNAAIKQLSCSWEAGSLTTAARTNMDNYFLKFAAQGQSFFAASGDGGASSGAIVAPDDDPNITLVGGTTLATAGPGGAWLGETVWNAGEGPGIAGSSGGVSTTYKIPTWQKGVKMTTNNGSTTYRNSPDVAMVADNIFIVADDGQNETTGGTSASAPLWAGLAALINQQAAAQGLSPIGFVNPALYHIGTNSAYTACFNDVTVGNNTNTSATKYLAVPGYDLCTGLGTANGSSLLPALIAPDGFQITPGRGAVGNGPAGGPFTVTNQLFTLTNNGATAFNWAVGCTSTWINISASGETLNPKGAAMSVAVTANAAANALPGGVYTADLWFTNLASGQVQLRQFTLQVEQDLVLDGGFEAYDFCYWTLTGSSTIYDYNGVDNGTYTGYYAEQGIYFAVMGEVSKLAYLSQALPTKAGQVYQLSLWVANPQGQTPNQFLVQWNTNAASANTLFNQTNMGGFDWSNMVFTVTASTNVTTLRFGFRNDNGFFTFDNVSVLPVSRPVLQPAAVAGGAVQLVWTAMPGVQYQVQYKTNLTQSGWMNLGSPVTATANPMTVSETAGANSELFYRIEGP